VNDVSAQSYRVTDSYGRGCGDRDGRGCGDKDGRGYGDKDGRGQPNSCGLTG